MNKCIQSAIALMFFLTCFHTIVAQTEVTYNFNATPTLSGVSSASGTVDAALVAGLTDNGITNSTNVLRPRTVGSPNNTGVVNLTSFPSSSDYSITWKEYITAGNTSLKKGFLMRGTGTSAYATGMRQGYYFMVQNNTTTGSFNFRILNASTSTITDIKNSGPITIPGFALNAACWFRASTTGNILKFEYSTDGVTFREGATTTDNTYSSGVTQLVYGIGSGAMQYLFDDITFKALLNSTIMVTGSNVYQYNGNPQGPNSATVTGSTSTISYTYTGTGSTNYGPSGKQPILAGSYQVVATVGADSRHRSAVSSAFSFTINSNPNMPTVALRRALSPTSPMYMIHVDAWSDQPQEIIDLIPKDILPYVVVNLSMSTSVLGDRGYDCAESWLNTCAQNGVWAMVQASSGIQNAFATDLDLNSYESLYKKYPNFIGYNFCEQAWGFDSNTFEQRLNLFTNLLEMGHKYGGFLYVNDNFSISGSDVNTIAKFKSNAAFANATKVYKSNMIFGNKFTNSFGFYDNESGSLGAFLSGHAGNYAVRYDMYSWGWSGKGQVFGTEAPGRNPDGNRAVYACPEAVMGVPIVEHVMLTGATVIDGPEVPWMSTFYRTNKLPPFDNMIADILRKILDGTIRIPTVNEVAARTKVVFVNDVDTNTTDSLFSGLYAMDGMLTNNRTWFKKSGRYASIPQLYSDSPSETSLFSGALIVKKSDFSSRWSTEQQKVSEFNSLYPVVSAGDMYVSRQNNSLFAYNPWLNTNTTTTASIPLRYNTCDNVELSYPAHTFSVINESSNKLQIYLNNYRTDKNQLWAQYPNDFSWFRLQNTILPLFATNPPDTTFRTSVIKVNGSTTQPTFTLTDRGSHKASTSSITWANGVFTLTIVHNGPVDISIDCAGIGSGRASVPLPMAVVSPIAPSAYSGEKEYEAEGALVTSPAAVSSNPVPITYHGTGFVRFSSTSSSNSSVRFKVINAEAAGAYALAIRYAALSSVSLVDIFVNGTRITAPIFPATGGENNYAVYTQSINLNQGVNNIIEFKARAAGAVINFDKITLTKIESSYFYKGSGLLTSLSSWGRNTNGSGDAPLSFTDDAQTFEVRNTTSVALDGVWTVSGVGSKVRLGSGADPAITFTLNSGSSIGGNAANVDVLAPVSGNHTIIYKNNAELSYGTVSDSNLAIVYDNASISSSSSNTFGSINIINGSFITYLHRPVVRNLNVDATSVLTAPTGPTNAYIAIPSGGSVVIDGRLKIPQLTGFVKSAVGTASSANGNIQFLGPENMFLGLSSIVEYSGSGSNQIVDVRTDYRNLRFTGSAPKTIGGGTIIAGTLTVNQSAPAAAITLLGDVTVNGSLAFTSGRIVTGVNTLTLGTSASSTGASQETGWVFGNLKKLTNAAASPSFTYAIGDATTYSPVELTFTGNTSAAGGLTASTFAGDHTAIGESAINASKKVNRTWTLRNDSLASFGTYSLGFTFANTETDANTTPARYVAGLYNGTTWSSLATSNASSTGATASGITGFGDFAIGERAPTVLPVADTAYNFCTGAKVSTLIAATGTGVKVYAAATGGVALGDVALKGTTVLPVAYFLTEPTLGGGESARVRVFVRVNALPATPATVVLTDDNAVLPATSSTAVTAVGAFVGTNTPFKLTATAVGAVSYRWTLPAGVVRTDVTGANTNTSTTSVDGFIYIKFTTTGVATPVVITVQSVNAAGCTSVAKASASITRLLPKAPSAIVAHDLSLPLPASGIPAAVKSFASYMGTNTVLRLTATPSLTATSYEWELPQGVTQLTGGTSNVITVNFAGVDSSNTTSFVDAKGITTHVLRIGVKAVNGVGSSITSNTGLISPATTSTAKLLTLTAVRPASPASVIMREAGSIVAVTNISRYIGTTTALTLTAAASPLASSYEWELPLSVTLVSGSLSSNVITVNFANVPAGTTSLYLGAKAVNGIASSIRVNSATLVPATSSTATLLRVSAVAPVAAGIVTGSLAICGTVASSVTYTIATAAKDASSYTITVPAGCTITGGSGTTATIAATANATFTVNYPAGFTASKTVIRTISIQSRNGFGVSVSNKVLALTNVGAVCTPVGASAKMAQRVNSEAFKVMVYPNPSTSVFTLDVQSSVQEKAPAQVQVYDMTGRLIEQRQVKSNSTIELGNNYQTGIYNVIVNQGAHTKSVRVIKK